jgi:hypothetical protein
MIFLFFATFSTDVKSASNSVLSDMSDTPIDEKKTVPFRRHWKMAQWLKKEKSLYVNVSQVPIFASVSTL